MRNADDPAVVEELREILLRTCDLMELAQFDENEKNDLVAAVQRLRLLGKNSEADELVELNSRARKLEGKHRTKQ